MKSKYNIPLNEIIKEFQLEVVYMPKDRKEIMVSSPEVARPPNAHCFSTSTTFAPCRAAASAAAMPAIPPHRQTPEY